MGETRRLSGEPLFSIFERNHVPCQTEDGCEMHDSKLMGTYIHGMFDSPEITKKWLNTIGLDRIDVPYENRFIAKDNAYDLLATHFENHMNIDAIFNLI
jgi:adenosylcobyric acid synthase